MPGPTPERLNARLPSFTSTEAFSEGVRDIELWREAVGAVSKHIGVPTGTEIVSRGARDTPTFTVGPGHVIKFYGSWARGHMRADTEIDTLTRLARIPDLPVPRLLATGDVGEIQGEWRYLAMSRIPGISLHDARDGLDAPAMVDAIGWMGRTLGSIHRVPLTDAEQADGRERFLRIARQQHARTSSVVTERGRLARHLAAQVEDWLPTFDELVPPRWPLVLLQNDLRLRHVLGGVQAGAFLPSGLIDFNRSFPGYPLWDLCHIWRDLRQEPMAARRAFLDAADIPGRDDDDFGRRALGFWLVQEADRFGDLSDINALDTLDEVAAHCFG